MSESVKPRVRVKAGSSNPVTTHDSFINAAANVGLGTYNMSSGGSYGFNPITRNRTILEWLYRGSWLAKKVVDCPADDMTREGIHIQSDMPPDQIDEIHQHWTNLQIWQRINSALKWARLYGGCVLVIMIDGHDPEQPLRLDTISRDQFKGLLVLDRWMLMPDYHLVKNFGADYGQPEFYQVVADARTLQNMKVHHSRIIRFDGHELPYWQKMAENEWGLSVIEPLWDRMIAFDSATQGAAQLIYKAHLRVLKLPQYRELVASGGPLFEAVMKQIQMIRMMQTNEGLTVIDGDDEYQANQYSFGGLSDMMIQFSQQASGAADVPMTRLFGQSPAGMNSTGESDLRNYYDGLKSNQEWRLRRPIKMLLDITSRSMFGTPLPKGFNFSFKPLWQLTDEVKSQIASATVQSVAALVGNQMFTPAMALKELRESSRLTGFGSNITDEDIAEAEANPPPPPGMEPGLGQGPEEQAMGETGGQVGQQQGQPPGNMPAPLPRQNPAATRPANSNRPPAREIIARLAQRGISRPSDDDAVVVPEGMARMPRRRALRRLTTRVNAHGAQINFDRRSIVDIDGLQVVIETAKGERRQGVGWAVNMPADYGYITGTNSAEGKTEQFDAFVGTEFDSRKVWLIEQMNPHTQKFDEWKAMLAFDNKDEALNAYHASYTDADLRYGGCREMSMSAFKSWLSNWKYGEPPPRTNGHDESPDHLTEP